MQKLAIGIFTFLFLFLFVSAMMASADPVYNWDYDVQYGGEGGKVVDNSRTNINPRITVSPRTNVNPRITNNNNPRNTVVDRSRTDNRSTANNQGLTQTTELKQNFEDAPDHIEGPQLLESKADLKDHDQKLTIKTKGSVWDRRSVFTYAEAKRLGKGASDAHVEDALYDRGKKKMKKITIISENEVISGYESMGFIYVLPEGNDCVRPQMEGKLMQRAMERGGTHMIPVEDIGAYLEGSQFNIGFSGAASILSSGGTTALAPGGGTGYGKAKSNNELRPAVMAEVFRDTFLNISVYIPAE